MANKLIQYVANNRTFDPVEVKDILLSMSRDEVIVFLAWNDSNGIYLDLDCDREEMPHLSEIDAKLLAMCIIWENNVVD